MRAGSDPASLQDLGHVAVAGAGTPALAVFNGTLYLAFTTTGTIPGVSVYRLPGTTWVETADLTPLADTCPAGLAAPALGAYNGRLFLACKDAGSTDVWLCSSADGQSWSGYEELSGQLPDVATATNPAVCALGSTLFLGFVEPPSSTAQVYSLTTMTPQ